eukprot:1152170-Pelagomonas_calceolata.AAC.14
MIRTRYTSFEAAWHANGMRLYGINAFVPPGAAALHANDMRLRDMFLCLLMMYGIDDSVSPGAAWHANNMRLHGMDDFMPPDAAWHANDMRLCAVFCVSWCCMPCKRHEPA